MKRSAPLVIGMLLASMAAMQAEPPKVAISGPTEPVCVYGGVSSNVRLVAEAPIGSTLAVQADLLQVAKGLAIPLSKNLNLVEGLGFLDRTHQVIEAPLVIPEVERVTQLLGRLQVRGAENEKWQAAGNFRVMVYPKEQPEFWKKFFAGVEKDHGLRLAIFGKSERLRDFLKTEEVPFEDLGSEIPARFEKAVLYLGESKADADVEASPGRIIVFAKDSSRLPGVYTTAQRDGVSTKVNLPVFEDLKVNPRTRQAFSEILQQHLNIHNP